MLHSLSDFSSSAGIIIYCLLVTQSVDLLSARVRVRGISRVNSLHSRLFGKAIFFGGLSPVVSAFCLRLEKASQLWLQLF